MDNATHKYADIYIIIVAKKRFMHKHARKLSK